MRQRSRATSRRLLRVRTSATSASSRPGTLEPALQPPPSGSSCTVSSGGSTGIGAGPPSQRSTRQVALMRCESKAGAIRLAKCATLRPGRHWLAMRTSDHWTGDMNLPRPVISTAARQDSPRPRIDSVSAQDRRRAMWQAGAMRRPLPRWRAWRLVRLCFGVHRALTAMFFGGVIVSGLLPPAFTIATGALVSAVARGDGAWRALAIVSALYLSQRLLAPLEDEFGAALARRVDESLTERLMITLADPPGLAHVEDPAMLDAI